jgi:hypothetical protein
MREVRKLSVLFLVAGRSDGPKGIDLPAEDNLNSVRYEGLHIAIPKFTPEAILLKAKSLRRDIMEKLIEGIEKELIKKTTHSGVGAQRLAHAWECVEKLIRGADPQFFEVFCDNPGEWHHPASSRQMRWVRLDVLLEHIAARADICSIFGSGGGPVISWESLRELKECKGATMGPLPPPRRVL